MRFNESQKIPKSVCADYFQVRKKRKIAKDRYLTTKNLRLEFQIPFRQDQFMQNNCQLKTQQSNYEDKLSDTFFARTSNSSKFIRSNKSNFNDFSEQTQYDFSCSQLPQIFKSDQNFQRFNNQYYFQKKELLVLKSPQQIHDSFYFNILDMNQQNYLAYTIQKTLYLNKSITDPDLIKITLPHRDTISSIKFSNKSSNIVAAGTQEGDFAICDIDKGVFVRTFNTSSRERISTIDWANSIVANGQKQGKIYLRDTRLSKNYIGKIHTHKHEVCQLKFNPHNPNYMISGGNDDLVFLYDIRKMKDIFKIKEHKAAVKALAWSNCKSNQFVSGGGSVDRNVCLWDSHQMRLVNKMTKESQICNLDYTSDGFIVASQGFPLNQIEIFDPSTLRTIEIFKGHSKRVLFMTTNNRKDVVVTASPDNTVRYWNAKNLKSDTNRLVYKEELDLNAGSFLLR